MTSDWYREEELKGDQEAVIAHVNVMVADARKRCPTVSFTADDATRTEYALLCHIVEAAIGQGATTIVLPERIGHATSFEYGTLFHGVRKRLKHLPGIEAVLVVS